jgi:GTP-binding protein EngB required for normal cell division
MVEYLGEVGVPTLVVLTKMDKLKKREGEQSIARALEDLELEEAQLLAFSSKTGQGRELLLAALGELVGLEGEDGE